MHTKCYTCIDCLMHACLMLCMPISYPAMHACSYPHVMPSLHAHLIPCYACPIKQPLQVLPNAHHASVAHYPINNNHLSCVARSFVALRPFRLRVHRLKQRTLTDTATNCVVLACLSLFSIRSMALSVTRPLVLNRAVLHTIRIRKHPTSYTHCLIVALPFAP